MWLALKTGGCLCEWTALLKLPDIENGQRLNSCPMSKMDRGLRRCTGFTIRRCLVCHFAAVAADEFKSCMQSIARPAVFHAIIQPASVQVS